MKFAWSCVLLLAACKISTSTGGSGSHYSGGGAANGGGDDRASGASTGHTVTVPDLFQMTRPEAEAAIRAAGITGPLEDSTHGTCDSAAEHEGGRPGEKFVIERGHICSQSPAAGNQTSSTLFVTVMVQNEDPWKGDLGDGHHWALMPNIVGMTVDEAKAKLDAAGFGKAPIKIFNVGGCAIDHICRQHPEALIRTDTTSEKELFVAD